MKRYAWAVLGLGLGVVGAGVNARPAVGQSPQPPVELKDPNRFDPTRLIPFRLSGQLFFHGHRPVVSLHVYNVLAQVVAIPILQGTGQRLDNVRLSCTSTLGCSYNAYWDGHALDTGRPVASGVYIFQLIVDSLRLSKKVVLTGDGPP